MGVSGNICPGSPQTAILLISASQIARITGISHWHLAAIEKLKSLARDSKDYHKVW
jgi:hypothetical protein